MLCDQRMNGEPIKSDHRLKIIAACNPYKKWVVQLVFFWKCLILLRGRFY